MNAGAASKLISIVEESSMVDAPGKARLSVAMAARGRIWSFIA